MNPGVGNIIDNSVLNRQIYQLEEGNNGEDKRTEDTKNILEVDVKE